MNILQKYKNVILPNDYTELLHKFKDINTDKTILVLTRQLICTREELNEWYDLNLSDEQFQILRENDFAESIREDLPDFVRDLILDMIN